MRFNNIPFLQHVVRYQHASLFHQSQHVRKPVDILALGCVHEDHIKGSGKILQDLSGISLQKRDL